MYCKSINLSLTITIHQRTKKASLLTGVYLKHNGAEQRKQIIIRCIAPLHVVQLINQCFTVRSPQLKNLTGIYFDHKSVEQSEKIVIRCNAPTSALK